MQRRSRALGGGWAARARARVAARPPRQSSFAGARFFLQPTTELSRADRGAPPGSLGLAASPSGSGAPTGRASVLRRHRTVALFRPGPSVQPSAPRSSTPRSSASYFFCWPTFFLLYRGEGSRISELDWLGERAQEGEPSRSAGAHGRAERRRGRARTRAPRTQAHSASQPAQPARKLHTHTATGGRERAHFGNAAAAEPLPLPPSRRRESATATHCSALAYSVASGRESRYTRETPRALSTLFRRRRAETRREPKVAAALACLCLAIGAEIGNRNRHRDRERQ